MTRQERRNVILKLLGESGRLVVRDLAARFGVSEMTVRRDLAALAKEGRVCRTYGGALAARRGVLEFRFQPREESCAAEKRAIASFVASQIHENMTISLDTGTTTLAVARAIAGMQGLTILTTSLAVAWTLASQDNVEVVLCGGTMRRNTPDLSGPVAEENIRRFRVNMAIVGADAVSPKGAFTNETVVARITRALMDNAERVMLVIDHTKFTSSAFVQYAPLSRFDIIVTDSLCPNSIRRWLKVSGPRVFFAPVESKKNPYE